MRMSRENRLALLGILISTFIFAGVLYYTYMSRPSRSGTFSGNRHKSSVSHQEFNREIRRLAESISSDSDRNRVKKDLSELEGSIYGGRQWLLLRLAAEKNKNMRSDYSQKNIPPVIELEVDDLAAYNDSITLPLTFKNTSEFPLSFTASLLQAECIVIRPNGKEVVINCSLQSIPGQDTITLYPEYYWGLILNIPTKDLSEGRYQMLVQVTFKGSETNVRNLFTGVVRTEPVDVVL